MPEKMTLHSVKIPEDEWKLAKSKAETDGRTVSEVIRSLLAAYSGANRTP